jgi:hypothetical protein
MLLHGIFFNFSFNGVFSYLLKGGTWLGIKRLRLNNGGFVLGLEIASN